jgi:hypothetical protein
VYLLQSVFASASGWPDAFVKRRPKMLPNPFFCEN